MKTYTCPNATRKRETPLLQCAKTGKPCVNQRFCTQRGETVLTAYAKDCPGRKPEPAKTEEPKPKKKAAAKKKKTDGENAAE